MKSKITVLQGKTLQTWPRSKDFEIVEVTTDRVIFIPKSGNGTRRWIPISKLLEVTEQNWDLSELRQKILIKFPDTWNSSYIAAIVQAIR